VKYQPDCVHPVKEATAKGVTGMVDEQDAPAMGGALMLTVEEAARLLRIGRSAAYEQARRYLATDGLEGIPVVRVGRSLRVPREALRRMLGFENPAVRGL
jgi:excisionase family DNA binding protein